MNGPLVKICGLTRADDARHADGRGADFLGVVLTPGFLRSVTTEAASTLFEATTARRVAVLVDERPSDAARMARAISASVVQLHGNEGRDTLAALRSEGDWSLWKAVRAGSLDDLRRGVDRVGDLVDGILVEGLRDGVVGGGGVRLELDPRSVRDMVPSGLTFVLAGGLAPESVGVSVARFRPDVVDVSSGVEREPGRKDDRSVAAFVRAVREAGSAHAPS